MSLAGFSNLVFSIGGLAIACFLIGIWLIARPSSRGPRIALLAVVLAYGAMATYPVPHAIAEWLRRDFRPLQRADVPPGPSIVVLLGSGTFTEYDWDNRSVTVLDPEGLSRTVEAARVFRVVDPQLIVCSGGVVAPNREDSPISTAMKETLMKLGVPASRILTRDGSGDTHEEAQMVAKLVPELHVDHVVVVTSGFHMPRALSAFRAAGIEAIPAPANDRSPAFPWLTRFLPGTRGMQEASAVGHELLGLLYYKLRGWR
jgi:uncharacterized SAM-binding protein YcdF (DUF218 family)